MCAPAAGAMETIVQKSTYLFEIIDEAGKPMKHVSQRCDNIRAREHTIGLLESTPGAAAVFGFEQSGLSVHSAYREPAITAPELE